MADATPAKDISFKTVADATRDVSLVDSLDMDDMEISKSERIPHAGLHWLLL